MLFRLSGGEVGEESELCVVDTGSELRFVVVVDGVYIERCEFGRHFAVWIDWRV